MLLVCTVYDHVRFVEPQLLALLMLRLMSANGNVSPHIKLTANVHAGSFGSFVAYDGPIDFVVEFENHSS